MTLTRLEIDWHEDLGRRFTALPLLLGSSTIWVFAAVLIGFAYRRRRKRRREKYAEWERQEREARNEARLIVSVRNAQSGRSVPSPTEADDEREVVFVVPPERRDAGIPTVVHEGRSHTLH